jgi:four helix bundle protein
MNLGSSKRKAQGSKEAPGTGVDALRAFDDRGWWTECEDSGPQVLHDGPAGTNGHPWEVLERATIFGEAIVRFSKTIPRDPGNNRLIDQVVGAGTSVGANYCEANEAVSKKDFRYTVSRSVKEAKETKFFLRMIVAAEPHLAEAARPLYREAHELLCIFASMRNKP